MLTVQNVGLTLGDRTILDDISFQAEPGEFISKSSDVRATRLNTVAAITEEPEPGATHV